MSSPFQATAKAAEAQSLTDGVPLAPNNVVLPWVAYGTYKLGKDRAYGATLDALRVGYRAIDTAFIYAAEKTETEVGRAIQTALEDEILSSRDQLFVITKHWRKYHGYDATMECLNKSLRRLGLTYVDLYLIHWPGPAYVTPFRSKNVLESEGPWAYASSTAQEMVHLRSETWRAMEDALRCGKVRAIGVSNFSVQHLETLKKTATIWPPAVNQIECHPLYPNTEVVEYCQKEGIVVQAYAALGGQDATKVQWEELLDGKTLLTCPVVAKIASAHKVTPAQVLLRYALQKNYAICPKTSKRLRMRENSDIFGFSLTDTDMKQLQDLEVPGESARLCWRNDPFRLLNFE
jgi:diketogulonate reductase-like aldo/keto reductase